MRTSLNIISFIAGCILLFGIYSGRFVLIIIGLIPLIIIAVITFLKIRNSSAALRARMVAEIEELKRTGELIEVDLDHCEIKDSSYSQEIIDDRMTRSSSINLDFGKVIGLAHVDQSLLMYNHPGSNGIERFIQAFPAGKESLKIYLIHGLVVLYVDPNKRSRYFFDWKAKGYWL